MVLIKRAVQAVSYIYASSILTSGPNTMTLLPNTYTTDLQCRIACNNNQACVQYAFWTFNNVPGCYTSTTTSTLTATGLNANEPGYIIAQKIPLITVTNFDSSNLASFAGLSWTSFYTCFSIFNSAIETSGTCGINLPSNLKSRAADGTFCKFSSSGGIPQAFSCDASSNLATSCYNGQGYSSSSKTCSICSNFYCSPGGVQTCKSQPSGSICISGRVTSCSVRPYGLYSATDTSVASCIICPNQFGFNWQSPTKPCTCTYPEICSGANGKVGSTSCLPGFGFHSTDSGSGTNQCGEDCSKYVGSGNSIISAFSLGKLPCAPCSGINGGGICVSPTSPTLKGCYAGYGFNPTDGVSPSSCAICSTTSPGTFSLGALPCSTCGAGAICGSTSSPYVSSCLPGYVFSGVANSASAGCTPATRATFSGGGRVNVASACAPGTAECDPTTGVTTQCLAKYGYSSTSVQTCLPCRTKTYSLGGISGCVPCYPTGATCEPNTGIPTSCPGAYYLTAQTCSDCPVLTYTSGALIDGNAVTICQNCPYLSTGVVTCDPTTGATTKCRPNFGSTSIGCQDCDTPNVVFTNKLECTTIDNRKKHT